MTGTRQRESWKSALGFSARRPRGPIDSVVDAVEVAWKDGTRSCYPNEACAAQAIANTDGTRVSFKHGIRFDVPLSLILNCPLCGLPWSDHKAD